MAWKRRNGRKQESCKLGERNKVACIFIFIYIYINAGKSEEKSERKDTHRKKKERKEINERREGETDHFFFYASPACMHLFFFDGCLVVLRSLIVLVEQIREPPAYS